MSSSLRQNPNRDSQTTMSCFYPDNATAILARLGDKYTWSSNSTQKRYQNEPQLHRHARPLHWGETTTMSFTNRHNDRQPFIPRREARRAALSRPIGVVITSAVTAVALVFGWNTFSTRISSSSAFEHRRCLYGRTCLVKCSLAGWRVIPSSLRCLQSGFPSSQSPAP
jgi:hypothetical protein